MAATVLLDRWPHLAELEREELRTTELVNEWHSLRARGVPAGSQTRRMAELRAALLAAGEWAVVNK